MSLWQKLGSSIPCASSCVKAETGRGNPAPVRRRGFAERGSISGGGLGMGKESSTFPCRPWLLSMSDLLPAVAVVLPIRPFAISFSFTGMHGNTSALLNISPILNTASQDLCTQQMCASPWCNARGCLAMAGLRTGLLSFSRASHWILSIWFFPAPFSKNHSDFMSSGADPSYLLPVLRRHFTANKHIHLLLVFFQVNPLGHLRPSSRRDIPWLS